MAELVGSAKAIQDGLKAVSKIVSEEMNSWTDDQREKCGKIEEWTVFGEEFLEDLGVSKHDFVAQMRSKEQL